MYKHKGKLRYHVELNKQEGNNIENDAEMAELDRQVQLEIAQSKGKRIDKKEVGIEKIESLDPNTVPKGQHIIPEHAKIKNKLIKLSTMQQLETILERQNDKLLALLFWAKWYPECEDLRATMEKLSSKVLHLVLSWVSQPFGAH